MNTVKLTFKAYMLLMALLPLLLFGLSKQASAIDLKHHSMVESDLITLGDVFEGLERDEDRVLGAAPLPGQDMVLNARTLLRIAVAMDLPWRPRSHADQVVLRRAATVIKQDMMKDRLQSALLEQGLSNRYNITIISGGDDIVMPPSTPETLEVESLDISAQQNRFEAVLAAPSKDNPVRRVSIKGTLERLVSVPVLRESMTAGTVIGANDLDMIDLPDYRVKHNIILNADDLIGTTPRRVLHAMEPVVSGDIEAPRIVERGESVTMVFRQGGLLLTAQGKALEYGAKGDMIRVVNQNSSKTVQGQVTGEREVTVAAF
ncbi:MAG: flagellar basal body P-ring formation protein FlgA [Alphaproteobacteria bacterium]|nr:flagellar basal body P-ring formation protein FlgA [Alphaproteobacteria bacterium]